MLSKLPFKCHRKRKPATCCYIELLPVQKDAKIGGKKLSQGPEGQQEEDKGQGTDGMEKAALPSGARSHYHQPATHAPPPTGKGTWLDFSTSFRTLNRIAF